MKNVSHLVILDKSFRNVDSPVTGSYLQDTSLPFFFPLSTCSVTAIREVTYCWRYWWTPNGFTRVSGNWWFWLAFSRRVNYCNWILSSFRRRNHRQKIWLSTYLFSPRILVSISYWKGFVLCWDEVLVNIFMFYVLRCTTHVFLFL